MYLCPHPFVERLIGSVRRELLDQTFFWTAADLANKLRTYQAYYNEHRCHSGRDGATPADSRPENVIELRNYRWEKYRRGLFQLRWLLKVEFARERSWLFLMSAAPIMITDAQLEFSFGSTARSIKRMSSADAIALSVFLISYLNCRNLRRRVD